MLQLIRGYLELMLMIWADIAIVGAIFGSLVYFDKLEKDREKAKKRKKMLDKKAGL